jgi:hypothetical protein
MIDKVKERCKSYWPAAASHAHRVLFFDKAAYNAYKYILYSQAWYNASSS